MNSHEWSTKFGTESLLDLVAARKTGCSSVLRTASYPCAGAALEFRADSIVVCHDHAMASRPFRRGTTRPPPGCGSVSLGVHVS